MIYKLKLITNNKTVNEFNHEIEIPMIGEGCVYQADFHGPHRFKIKDERHIVSKVKTLAPIDVEKLNNIQEFVAYSVTYNRFEQGVQQVFAEETPTIKRMGDLIRWVVNDIMSEEIDTMVKNNLEPKDVNKYISTKVREMFGIFLDKQSGLNE